MPELEVVKIPTTELVEYRNNAKLHPIEQIDQIAQSIWEFGFNNPILAWHNDEGEPEIVAGHGRLMAARKLGLRELPVVFLDHMTEEQRRAYILVDNQLTMNSGFDDEILSMELQNIFDIDMSQFDFDIELDDDEFEESDGEVEEDEVPEDVPSIVQKGDVWQLGRHRLMCGDSSDKECVSLLMGQETAELLLTDPPYGIKADKGFSGSDGFNGKGKPIPRRQYKDDWDSYSPSEQAFSLMLGCCKSAIVFGGNFFTDKLPVGNHWLVWNKHNTMPTFSDAELAWTNIQRNSVKIYDVVYNGLIGKEKERYHPTQKPVKLISDIIRDYTKENDLILDLYGGSGTTLIAAEQLDRTCYMMELDPHYCDIIIERWQNLTGQTACKVEQDG